MTSPSLDELRAECDRLWKAYLVADAYAYTAYAYTAAAATAYAAADAAADAYASAYTAFTAARRSSK
jgi:hypothetical protein